MNRAATRVRISKGIKWWHWKASLAPTSSVPQSNKYYQFLLLENYLCIYIAKTYFFSSFLAQKVASFTNFSIPCFFHLTVYLGDLCISVSEEFSLCYFFLWLHRVPLYGWTIIHFERDAFRPVHGCRWIVEECRLSAPFAVLLHLTSDKERAPTVPKGPLRGRDRGCSLLAVESVSIHVASGACRALAFSLAVLGSRSVLLLTTWVWGKPLSLWRLYFLNCQKGQQPQISCEQSHFSKNHTVRFFKN